jgi:hypothetical protein
MTVRIVNIGLNRLPPHDHVVVVRTDEPEEFMDWIKVACPNYSNVRHPGGRDDRYPDLQTCICLDLNDRDLMLLKLRWK